MVVSLPHPVLSYVSHPQRNAGRAYRPNFCFHVKDMRDGALRDDINSRHCGSGHRAWIGMRGRLALRTPGGNHRTILLRQDEVSFQLHFFESCRNFSLTQPNMDKFCFSFLN